MMRAVFKRFGLMLSDWLRRVRHAWVWIVLQFAGVALLIAIGLLWTRIPEKHVWQVLLTLLLPLLLAAGFVVIQAGTFRGFLHPGTEGTRRIPLGWGAATLLIWIAIIFLGRFIAYDHIWGSLSGSKA